MNLNSPETTQTGDFVWSLSISSSILMDGVGKHAGWTAWDQRNPFFTFIIERSFTNITLSNSEIGFESNHLISTISWLAWPKRSNSLGWSIIASSVNSWYVFSFSANLDDLNMWPVVTIIPFLSRLKSVLVFEINSIEINLPISTMSCCENKVLCENGTSTVYNWSIFSHSKGNLMRQSS